MSPYSAVATTGIYCRPGCPARPDPRNVRYYAQPAAAEADGFRACLRCRPYRSAPAVSWDGPELVCRAIQPVLRGAPDGATHLWASAGASPARQTRGRARSVDHGATEGRGRE